MQFCNDCGAILNLFQFPDREQCPDCYGKEQAAKKPIISNPEKKAEPNKDITQPSIPILPDDVTLSYEDGKLVVSSSEGWSLWSGDISSPQKLSMIIARAERIYGIRAKRHNK
ncbi:MAG: hypothetical protein OCC45_14300 [Desulfotalea sp.]